MATVLTMMYCKQICYFSFTYVYFRFCTFYTIGLVTFPWVESKFYNRKLIHGLHFSLRSLFYLTPRRHLSEKRGRLWSAFDRWCWCVIGRQTKQLSVSTKRTYGLRRARRVMKSQKLPEVTSPRGCRDKKADCGTNLPRRHTLGC